VAPSLPEQEYFVEMVMEFDNAPSNLGRSSRILLVEVTEKQVRRAVVDEINSKGLEISDFKARANVKRQTRHESPLEEEQRSSNEGERFLRLLQEGALIVSMEIYTKFKSTHSFDQERINDIIGGAFNSDEDRAKYVKSLRDTGDPAFSSISSVLVTINGVPQLEPDESQAPPEPKKKNIWLIIGPVISGVFLFLILFAICFARHKSAKKKASSQSPTLTEQDGRVSTTIEVECSPDEVSTLGDPVFTGGAAAMFTGPIEKDETVAAESSADYDYARFYGGAECPRSAANVYKATVTGQSSNDIEADNSQVASGRHTASSGSNITDTVTGRLEAPSLFSDDASFERQYSELEDRIEVIAPAGKLGVVIDTPHGGVPVVHAIKDTSVLADKIKVGDRLIYVDDEDTTRMTAIEVSRLISRKAQNPERSLIFVRYRSTED